MKTAFLLFFALVLYAVTARGANVPLSIKGQHGTKTSLVNLEAQNKSVTATGPTTFLLGDGDNILENGSFEHSTYSTGWTNSDGTLTAETGAAYQAFGAGTKSAKLVTAADYVEFYQDSTLYASSSLGVAGTISGWIANTAPNVYFCQRIAGAWVKNTDGTGITNCKLVNQTGVYTQYSMPVIFGATSNGAGFISLTPTTAAAVTTTGTTYFDKIKVAAGQSFGSVANVGPLTDGVCTSTWVTNATTACKYRQIGEFLEVEYKVLTSGAPTAATLTVTLPTGFTADITKIVGGAPTTDYQNVVTTKCNVMDNGTNSFLCVGHYATTTSVSFRVESAAGTYASGTYVNATTPQTFANLDTVTATVLIPVTQFTTSSSVVAQPSDSFSTDTNVLSHKTTAIVASDPVGTYNTFSNAINTNTQVICATAPTTLPSNANGVLIYSRAYNAASTCNLPARYEIKVGYGMKTVQTEVYKSTGKVTIGSTDFVQLSSSSQRGLYLKEYDALNGVMIYDAMIASTATTVYDFLFKDITTQTSGYLVINAQKKKDWVVGDISGLEKCATTLDCTDDFVVRVAAGNALSGMNYPNWVTSCTGGAAAKTCTFAAGIFPTSIPSCQVSALNSSYRFANKTESLASVSVSVYRADTVALVDEGFTLTCSRTGADYLGKTAKAVASDQNDRTPSIVGAKTCHYTFGGTGSISAPTECTTGTCIEYEDNCGTGTPPAWSTVATYSGLTFAAGTFANSSPISCTCVGYDSTSLTSRKCLPVFITGNNTVQTDASGGYNMAVLGYNPETTSSTIYAKVSCKGQAP